MHSTACERCHRRKVRCDKAQPQCTPCARANASCQYMTSEHQLRRRNIQKLERRIRDLEAENEALSVHQHHHHSRDGSRRPDTASDGGGSGGGGGGGGPLPPPPPLTSSASRHTGPPTATGNSAVAEQVMHMSLIAGGSDHFVGSASGILLANLLQNYQTTSSASIPTTNWHQSAHPGSQSPDSIPPLPAKSLARNLVQAYCNHDHLCYPFLSIEKLQQSFDAVYDANAPDAPSDSFFVDMVLAIGTAQVHKFNWNGVYDAELHYNRAMTKLGDVMAQGGIERLQALLLVCQYRMGSTSRSTTASVWHLIGVAARMCLEMGLHRATTYSLPAHARLDGRTQSELLQAMNLKKRCFWSLVAIDRVASIALGRPLSIQLEDIDVDLPSASHGNEAASNYPTPNSPLDAPGQSESTAIFAHIVAYRVLCGRILNALYRNPKNSSSHEEQSFEHIRHHLAEELREWNAATVNLPLLDGDRMQHGAFAGASSFRSTEWYKLLFHNAMLMLYRPSPCLCDASSNSTTLQHVFESSREAISLYASLHRSKKMNYSWITMHYVFNAGLSNIYALRNHLQSLKTSATQQGPLAQLSPKPSINQVVNDTRSCSKVLVAVAERWDVAKNCSDLFDRLSDAVISDIVETTRAPPTTAVQSNQALNASQIHPDASDSMHIAGNYYDPMSNSNYLHMTVDNTFRDCFGDLQDLALDEYHNDALSQLSQEWFLGLGEDILMGR